MKILLTLIFCLLLPAHALSGVHDDLWNKYLPHAVDGNTLLPIAEPPTTPTASPAKPEAAILPGKIIGVATEERQKAFQTNWKYRKNTYELHFEDPKALARTAYGIALTSADIDENLPQEKFVAGVLGYHYSMEQVCHWATSILAEKKRTILDEGLLLGYLLSDGIIRFENGHVVSTHKVTHILAAAPGKKRTYTTNLLHERLHVFWDEDSDFRNTAIEKWKQLSPEELAAIRKELHQYAKDNEKQLMEEWAVKQAEKNGLPIN